MRTLLLFWFKVQAAKSARRTLVSHFNKREIENILNKYWRRYLQLRIEVPHMPTLGGAVMVHLSAMSTAFYQILTEKGVDKDVTTQLFYDTAWEVYKKMGRFSWWLARWGNQSPNKRLLQATRLFRMFPFNSPSYQWREVKTEKNTIGFDCLKCPVAEYFQKKGLSEFCAKTWCAMDFPLAQMWNAKLERNGSIAAGATVCDFRWRTNI